MKKSFNGRKFQLWHYKVSHGELLLRSPKDINNSNNIDIMFFDVKYVELPRFLPNLEIEEMKNEDVLYIKEKINKLVESKDITILSSNNYRYLVVASIVKIVENELDIFELPFERHMELSKEFDKTFD